MYRFELFEVDPEAGNCCVGALALRILPELCPAYIHRSQGFPWEALRRLIGRYEVAPIMQETLSPGRVFLGLGDVLLDLIFLGIVGIRLQQLLPGLDRALRIRLSLPPYPAQIEQCLRMSRLVLQ